MNDLNHERAQSDTNQSRHWTVSVSSSTNRSALRNITLKIVPPLSHGQALRLVCDTAAVR